MGLKLKWFRRRITFDGIPPAPERDIRRKEATAGTVIGVYRQSTHFEDFIEPVRSSYWEPPPQAIARATMRSNGNLPTTSTNSPSSNSSSSSTVRARVTARSPQPPVPQPTGISSVSRPASMTNVVAEADSRDKIGRTPVERLQLNADYDTPPEPSYAAPKPPVRKGVSKAKSMQNLANSLEDANNSAQKSEDELQYALRSPQSVEVLSDPRATTPAPPSPIHVVPITPIPRTISSNSLPLREAAPSPVRREISDEPEYIVPLASEDSFDEPIYDSFDTIFERVKARKPISPGSERSNMSARPVSSSPLLNREAADKSTEDEGVIFERIKLRSSPPPSSVRSSTTVSLSRSPSPSPPPQRKPVLQVTNTNATAPNPPTALSQPKSILKKRAPAPPPNPIEATSSMVEFTNEMVTAIPTPPPRSIQATTLKDTPEKTPPVTPSERKQEELPSTARPQTSTTLVSDSDSDDDFNWDFVQKHRSSINQTVAAHSQIDPEVLRNAPASLRNGMMAQGAVVSTPRSLPEPIAQPRTLRGMRNQRAHTQQESNHKADVPAVQIPPPRARASDSNASETSA
uniref:Uncharacterized protein n=1 Tax=Anopheles christyi TaxID=43041 RepID=A0A182KI32_9DIPT